MAASRSTIIRLKFLCADNHFALNMNLPFLNAREKVGIFVSYRRADTAGHTGRLVDHLKTQFGQQVFFDVDSISPGANFHKVIEETFAKCGAVVVLIGKRWLERDDSMPPFGDSKDVITQELRFAMESNLPIVPVLVDGASMPAEAILPPQFAGLSKLNAIDLRHTSFDRDLQAVRDQLGEILGAAKATAIEKGFLKVFGPFFGSSFARISGGIVFFSVVGALWGLVELAAAGIAISQQGLRSLFFPSIFDPEVLRLHAVWTAAFGAFFFGFIGRRSIRWWRHATAAMWVSLAEIILATLLAFVYVVQVPEARIMDLFESKKTTASP